MTKWMGSVVLGVVLATAAMTGANSYQQWASKSTEREEIRLLKDRVAALESRNADIERVRAEFMTKAVAMDDLCGKVLKALHIRADELIKR